MDKSIVKFNNVSFSYPSKDIFKNASLDMKHGEFIFLVGESGIGKTTLMKLLYFDLKPDEGTVQLEKYSSTDIDKSSIPELRQHIGIVFQDFKLLNDRNVYDNIALPLNISGEKKEYIKKKVYDVASTVGLLNRLNEMPYDLSGGEQQRVVIARSVVNDPILLFADEPTGNLDPFIALDIIKLLMKINMSGTSVIVATHNFDIIKRFKDKRIIQIKDERLFDVRVKN
ncbi:MAG TPA: ATP-binding cassette domain-containing protein [Ignavibacteria bacterium]|nr:ATP-binding cassette domain-containing protein [Ignavibacteria bacterium]